MTILNAINTKGYIIVPEVFSLPEIALYHSAVKEGISKEVLYHGTTDYYYYGSILLAPIYGGVFLHTFDNILLTKCFEEVLGEECILYTYTTSCIPPNSQIYTARIHVDSPRIIKGYHTSLVAMVLLDDFSPENGAPYFLPYSQEIGEAPDKESFFNKAEIICGKAGSVIFFNPRVWHCGGNNNTPNWRNALIIGMIRPWMKQRFDIPRALKEVDLQGVSDKNLQKLGFFSQPPCSYDEYFLPNEKRTFKQKTV